MTSHGWPSEASAVLPLFVGEWDSVRGVVFTILHFYKPLLRNKIINATVYDTLRN